MPADLTLVTEQWNQLAEQAGKLPSGPQPPDNGDMISRVTALETRLDTILPTLATKADLADVRADLAKQSTEFHKGFGDVVRWIIGAGFTAVALVISAMTFLQKAAPTAPQQIQQPPIIINVPSASPAPAPAAPAAKR